MEEKIISGNKNGMQMLLILIGTYIAGILMIIAGAIHMDSGRSGAGWVILFVIGMIYVCTGWILFLGLKVIGPNEALVLTLFGKYIGTLKENGFYYVNPFCIGVNPAASTKLSQSGDVDGGKTNIAGINLKLSGAEVMTDTAGKKISLKAMTLNNTRQKINDYLGNPIEVGVAVVWQVVDTAQAVFAVDNYKEFLSLQCDSAVRNIVKLYPYDAA
ncbi:MAG: SPFH domain-containing protein, partial [Lachnospiraceae bacterium]|nr:SPFH domain-containing protein [Lachnospiraceae bacterium]